MESQGLTLPPQAGILDGLLPVDALAAELGVHVRTLTRLSDQPNGLPYVRLGARRYYRIETVKTWILAQERAQNPLRRGGRRRVS